MTHHAHAELAILAGLADYPLPADVLRTLHAARRVATAAAPLPEHVEVALAVARPGRPRLTWSRPWRAPHEDPRPSVASAHLFTHGRHLTVLDSAPGALAPARPQGHGRGLLQACPHVRRQQVLVEAAPTLRSGPQSARAPTQVERG